MTHETDRNPAPYDAPVPRDDGHAGTPPPPYERRALPLKSPVLAIILSAIMPGLGQVYVGYYRHAFTYIAIFASVVALLSADTSEGLTPLLGIFLGFFYFYQVVDAGRKASLINQVLERGTTLEPGRDELPDRVGFTFGGGVLVVVGLLALGHNVFDMDLAWLEDWWPAGLVATGAWIILRGRGGRDETS